MPGPQTSPIAAPVRPALKVVSAPKAKARAAQEEIPAQDTLRLLAKLKKKRLTQQKSVATEQESPVSESVSAPSAGGHGGLGLPGSGIGLVADAGPAFPYPWYLKAIADRLDKQWKPPQEFDPDTVCQVTFVIDRTGQVSGSKISKSSRDQLFDQLALRAVLYSNPLPPLPNGFPDDTLTVHMKFVGRRL